MAINPNENQITNATFYKNEKIGEAMLNSSSPLMSVFTVQKDSVVNAVQKIRKMIFVSSHLTEWLPQWRLLSWVHGISDEELAIDTSEIMNEETVTQLIDNHKDITPTWRPATYSLPGTYSICPVVSFNESEYLTVTRNPNELNELIAAKYQNLENQIISATNGIKKGAIKSLIKLVLKIYKKAPKFQANTAYTLPQKDNPSNAINEALYGYDLTFLKNADESKIGVLFNNITAEEQIASYEAAEEAGKIRTLNIIKKVKKPGTGNTAIEKAESGQEFIRQLQQFSNQLMDNISGYTLNGLELGPTDRQLTNIFLSDVIPNINVDVLASTFNVNYLNTPLLAPATFINEFFSNEEIAEDEAAEAEDKLGLKNVYGLITDLNGDNPAVGVHLNRAGTYFKIIDDINHNKLYYKYAIAARCTISPNKFITILIDE